MLSDFLLIFSWWAVLFLIGVIFLPLTVLVFANFFDRGYIFAKVMGTVIISYLIFLLGALRILPFGQTSIITIITVIIIKTIFLFKVRPSIRLALANSWKIFLFEEIIFLTTLVFWSYIRAHEPSIHGLEKYMDFGFVNSILRTDYFPAKDLWLTPFTINYYYFGHLVTAVLTKLSGINSAITFNLMITTLFALTFVGAFSIGANLVFQIKLATKRHTLSPLGRKLCLYAVVAGLLTAFLVTFAGNLHTIYAFFSSYNPDTPVPFWQLKPLLNLSSYWYPNATRFIPFTIHEFPIYSFVVSDLHGHVLSIPIVLTIIALLLQIVILNPAKRGEGSQARFFGLRPQNDIWAFLLLSLLLAVAYMTNAWDGLIYFTLTALVLFYLYRKNLLIYLTLVVLVLIGIIAIVLPFSLHFKPFVSGIGLVKDHSPLYMLVILWGFFYFWVISFMIFIRKKLNAGDIFVLLMIVLSTLLIIIPEFFYAKDIYPAHYRANTMFKLGYQAFIMLSIASGYTIVRIVTGNIAHVTRNASYRFYLLPVACLLLLVMSYPFFAINSYYGNLKTYRGLDGLLYLAQTYPTDYQAILWLRENVKGQPVILEANGESYTDFTRVSANTGLPTVIGWPVHEWLWRGSYDVAAPRIADVQTLYESPDISLTKELLKKYNVSLIFVGDLERQKYQNLNEDKFRQLSQTVFKSGQTSVYQLRF